MPKKFRITAPDGKTYDITGPDGSTPEQALEQVKQMHGGGVPDEPQVDLNHLFPEAAGPHSDDRSAGEVALDQALNIGKGAVSAVTGIPGMLSTAAGIAKDAITGNASGAASKAIEAGKSMVHGITDPLVTSAQGARALAGQRGVLPDTTQAPTQAQWEDAAQKTGNLAGGIALTEGVKAIPTDAAGIQGVANKLRAIRGTQTPGVPTTTMQAVRTGAGMVASPAASLVEKLAKIRAGMDTTPAAPAAAATPASAPIEPTQELAQVGAPASYYHADTPANPSAPIEPTQELAQQGAQSSQYTPPVQAPAANPIEPNAQMQQMQQPVQYPDTPTPESAPAPAGTIQMSPEQMQQASAPPLIHPDAGTVIPRDIQMAREAILHNGAARSQANLIKVSRNVPELLKTVPELKGVPPGAGFDTRLYNAYKSISHDLNATEASIPDNTPVPTGDAVSQLSSLEQKYLDTNQPSAVRAINKVKSFLEERPSMDWADFIKAKRAFFNEIKLSSGAGREAYQIFKKLSNDVSPELGDANQKYYTVKSAIENANMDVKNGERIRDIGKPTKSKPVGYDVEKGKGSFALPL